MLGGSNAPSGAAADLNFTFSVNTATAGSTTSTQFRVPFVGNNGFTTVDVDWGDGNSESNVTVNDKMEPQILLLIQFNRKPHTPMHLQEFIPLKYQV